MAATAPPTSNDLHLRDYVRPILDRKWFITVVVILVTAGTYLYYNRQPRIYEASTTVYVGSQASGAGSAVLPISQRTVADEATLIVSGQVAAAVASKLGRPAAAAALAGSVSATPAATSDFIAITAEQGAPAQAAVVANGFAQAFITITGQQQRTSLTKQLRATRAQLAQLPRGPASDVQRAQLNAALGQIQLLLAAPGAGISQVDPAVPPGAPIAPRPVRNALFAFAISLLAALGIAFGLERFDRRFRRPEEIGPAYGLTPLATVPHSADLAYKVDDEAALGPDVRESFRQLRTAIQLSSLDRPIRRILVTSAVAGEGKSTVVRNLALAFHEWGHRVAVVDADLRRPTMVAMFGEPHEFGLTSVLTGAAALEDALVDIRVNPRGRDTLAEVTKLAGPSSNGSPKADMVSLLTSGPLPTNAQAVLAADKTHALLNQLGAHHDIVLIDSPPLLLVSDAISLMGDVDAVIIVARLGLTTRDDARNVSELIKRIPDARAIGVVVNDVSAFESYGYGYGYGYGGAESA
jgi:Mrp family chromosome partitioning ATPase/capsular polysaccharide biosynthesis protein